MTSWKIAAFNGFNTRGAPRRLRHDCQSEDGLVILEAPFVGDGSVISRSLKDLVQVGVWMGLSEKKLEIGDVSQGELLVIDEVLALGVACIDGVSGWLCLYP